MSDGPRALAISQRRTSARIWICGLLLAALGVGALAVDVPVAVWVHDGNAPRVLHKLCGLSEAMGHGVGVALIVVVIAVLDPARRAKLPRITTAALGAGLMANGLKLVVARTRPNHFDFDSLANGLETFGGWLPLSGNPSWSQGFPSSHAATAVGLAIVLSSVYPSGRLLFAALALFAGMQRVLEEAHFSSDVLWGAAMGCFVAPLCVYYGRLTHAFDRLEAWLGDRSPVASAAPDHASPASASARRSQAA